MLRTILDYFWPSPPRRVSRESDAALAADIKATGILGLNPLGDVNRNAVDVWIRHSDRQSRAENLEWLKGKAKVLALRWAVLSCALWAGAWTVSGRLIAQAPLALAAFTTGIVAIALFRIARALNTQRNGN